MRVAIVGSRGFNNYDLLKETMDQLEVTPTEIISGGAVGADQLGERWAKEKGIQTKIFYPDWKLHGKSAGYIRNKEIINNCDYCVAFWDGSSKGTQHSMNICNTQNKPLKVVRY